MSRFALLLLPFALFLQGAVSGSQDPEELPFPDKREEVRQWIEELRNHVKQRGKEDEEAIHMLDLLTQEFPRSGPKDRKAIVKAVAQCFRAKRPKPLETGEPDDRLYYAAATALSTMGPESVKTLVKLEHDKGVRKLLRVRRRLLISLGETRQEGAIDPLLDRLDAPEPEIQAAAAEALAEFHEAPQKVRKKIFEELLKILMGQKARKDLDPNDIEAHERWNTISGPIVAALQRLTGLDERDPARWQAWWNDNKKKDWDAFR